MNCITCDQKKLHCGTGMTTDSEVLCHKRAKYSQEFKLEVVHYYLFGYGKTSTAILLHEIKLQIKTKIVSNKFYFSYFPHLISLMQI